MQCPLTGVTVAGAKTETFEDPAWGAYTKLCAKAGFTATEELSKVKLTEKDALIVVDMQNDFVSLDQPVGGRFGVAGGGVVAATICTLIERFAESGAVVVATRDYHPCDHASFAGNGGRFPPHCVQGSTGSEFYPPIKDALQKARAVAKDKVKVAFKGFHEDIDSFGAFEYTAQRALKGGFPQSLAPDEQAGHRVSRRDAANSKVQQCMGCTLEPWTGSFVFKQSNLEFSGDLDAPPDVLSVMHSKRTLKQALLEEGIERVFVCGLALDFCVFDTALNAKDAGFKDVVFLLDAARPAFVPGYLPFYGGFAHEPSWTCAKLEEAGVLIWSAGAYLRRLKEPVEAEVVCTLQEEDEVVIAEDEEAETASFLAAARFFALGCGCNESEAQEAEAKVRRRSSRIKSTPIVSDSGCSTDSRSEEPVGYYPTMVQLGEAETIEAAKMKAGEEKTGEAKEGEKEGENEGEEEGEEVLRILCLHGFRMNSDLFRWQSRELREELEAALQQARCNERQSERGRASSPSRSSEMPLRVEWVYADAPHKATGDTDPEMPLDTQHSVQLREWYSRANTAAAAAAAGCATTCNGYRKGWRGPEYDGLAESVDDMELLQEVHGPFHGIIGFGQGAALATLLVARAEQANAQPHLGYTPLRDLRWALFLSGVGLGSESGRKWLHQHELLAGGGWPSGKLPTLHLYDAADECADGSRALAQLLSARPGGAEFVGQVKGEGGQRASGRRREAASTVLHHSQGHVVPSGEEMTGFVRAWFAPFVREHVGGHEWESVWRKGGKRGRKGGKGCKVLGKGKGSLVFGVKGG
jgi:nicotinamidase-related amidase